MSCERTVPEALARATQHCRARREMRVQEAEDLVAGLADPGVADAAKVEFLLAWAEKGETAGELAGLARAFLARARPAGLSGRWGGHPLADTCGTGGGGRSIVNISTAAAVVVAAAGIPVAKHGNRGVTRPSGSADALTLLGWRRPRMRANWRTAWARWVVPSCLPPIFIRRSPGWPEPGKSWPRKERGPVFTCWGPW